MIHLRDAAGARLSQAINDNGEFIFDLAGLTAPYLLWAEGTANGKEALFYSMANEGGMVNVTPATHCIMAMALGQNPESYYRDNPNAAPPDAAKVEEAKRKLSALFSQLYASTGVPADFDLMEGQFAADGSGFDGIMDVVDMNSDDQFVTIVDRGSNTELLKQELATGNAVVEESPERVNEVCLAGMAVLDAVYDILYTLSSQFATMRPNYDQLLAVMEPLMSDQFRDNGRDRIGMLTGMANGAPVGFDFDNIALYRKMKSHTFGDVSPWSIDELPSGYAEGVWCTYTYRNGNEVAPAIAAFVRETADGPCKWHGDQNPFRNGGVVGAESVLWMQQSKVSILSGIRFRTEDRNNAAFNGYGITKFMVINDALPSFTSSSGNNYKALVLSKAADPSVYYNITSTVQTWGGRHFEKDGLDIDTINEKEFIFVGLDSSNNPVHVWVDLLGKRPIGEAVLWKDALERATIGEFSSYFSELLSIWGQSAEVYMPAASLDSAAVPLQWELSPNGNHVYYAEVGLWDNNGSRFLKGVENPAYDDATLSLTDWISTTLDISSLGLTWPPVSGWSYIQTHDDYGRRYSTETDFIVEDLPDPSISISGQYLQYRTFSDPAKNQFRGWIDLLDLGLPIEDTITNIELTNLTTSASIPIAAPDFDKNFYFSNWSGNMTNNELSPVWDVVYYSGYGVSFPAGTDLAAGDYQFVATTQEGDAVSSDVITLGSRVELPVVDLASMSSEWVNGDLKLKWQNQTAPQGTQIRIWVVKGIPADFSVYLSVTVPQDYQEITIPKRVIDSAKILHGVDSASWRIELRYSENNINSARGVSDWAEIPGWNS
jgi:hypothetical protein